MRQGKGGRWVGGSKRCMEQGKEKEKEKQKSEQKSVLVEGVRVEEYHRGTKGGVEYGAGKSV